MPTIAEIQAKAAAVKAAQQAEAIAGKATASASSTIATGLQSSAESVAVAPSLEIPEPVMDEKLAKESLGVYKAEHLRKFFRPDGAVVHNAINGFFYAKDEIDLTELDHFERLGKVSKVEVKEEKKAEK